MKTAKPNAVLPAIYRLTLTAEVFALVVGTGKLKPRIAMLRPDGKWNVGILMSVVDLITTEALPGENWNETVKRMVTK